MSIASSKLIKLLWIAIEKFGMTIVSIITFFIYARLLSPSEFGLGVLALSVGQSVSIMFGNLFEDALVQNKEPQEIHYYTAFWGSLVISILLIFSILLISYLVVSDDNLLILIFISLFHILFVGLYTIYVAQCRRLGQFSILAKRSVIARLTGASVGMIMAFGGYGALVLVIQSLLFEVIGFIYLFLHSKFKIKARFDWRVFKQLLSIGWLLCLRRLSWDAAIRGIPIILGSVSTMASVGVYGFSWRIVEMPRSAIFSGLMSYALPVFSRRQDDRRQISSLFLNSTKFTYLAIVPLFVGLGLVCPSLIKGVFGDKWIDAILPIQILCIVAVISLSRVYAIVSFTAVKKPSTALFSDLCGTMFALTITAYYGGEYGVYAASSAMLIRVLITFPFSINGLKILLDISRFKQVYVLLPTMAASILMMLSVYCLNLILVEQSLFTKFITECIVGFIGYVVGCFIFFPHWIREFKEFLNR